MLAEVYSAEGGDYLEHGPEWDAEHWSQVLSKSKLAQFSWDPDWGMNVTRGRLLDLWTREMDERDAVIAFFLTMVWGLGNHYLGPYKIEKMLTSRALSDLGAFLLRTRQRVSSAPEGEEAEALRYAYLDILGANISHVGPVYATKLLYAMSPQSNRSPVMDVWVKRWGSRYGHDFALDSTQKWAWNADKLAAFVLFCDDCTSAFTTQCNDTQQFECLDRGFIEYLIFWDSKYRSRKPWPPSSEFPLWVTKVDVS